MEWGLTGLQETMKEKHRKQRNETGSLGNTHLNIWFKKVFLRYRRLDSIQWKRKAKCQEKLIKLLNFKKYRIFWAARKKGQVTYKGIKNRLHLDVCRSRSNARRDGTKYSGKENMSQEFYKKANFSLLHLPLFLATIDLFTVSIVFLSPKLHRVGNI